MHICCIVKPSALAHTEAIIKALRDADMPVQKRRNIIYTLDLIDTLYDHMSAEARQDITDRMASRPGVALLVESESVEALLKVAGSESDPARCAPNSIRARFAKGAPEERVGSSVWFENAFHRPVNDREAARDVAALFPEFVGT